MRILISNKFYYPRGGDCMYTLNLEEMLRGEGHEVAIFSMQHPGNLTTRWSKYFPTEVKFSLRLRMLEAFLRPFGTKEVQKKFIQVVEEFQPDIVHLNNIHTQLSPIIGEIAHKRNIKVIWTLHDYKLLCPRYDCLCKGKHVCEECFTDKRWVLNYKCMKNSMLASFLAYQEALRWSRDRLESMTDVFICPSQFMRDKMIQGGFHQNKFHTLCNFIDVVKTIRDNFAKEEYYCFVGRLSHEKGLETLIEAARQLPYLLKIIGGGPLLEKLKTLGVKNIEFLGYKQWAEIKEIVGKARFSVIPSEWYENNPLSVIESQCLGTPVLGSRIGGIPELIDGNSGMLFEPRNVEDLKQKIEAMFIHPFNYKLLAETSQNKYSAEKYYQELMTIYQGKQ